MGVGGRTSMTVLPIECAAMTTFVFCRFLRGGERQDRRYGGGAYLNPSMVLLSFEKYPSRSSRFQKERRQSYGARCRLFVS